MTKWKRISTKRVEIMEQAAIDYYKQYPKARESNCKDWDTNELFHAIAEAYQVDKGCFRNFLAFNPNITE